MFGKILYNFFVVYWFLPVLFCVICFYFIRIIYFGKYKEVEKFATLVCAVFFTALAAVSTMFVLIAAVNTVLGWFLFWSFFDLIGILGILALRFMIVHNVTEKTKIVVYKDPEDPWWFF